MRQFAHKGFRISQLSFEAKLIYCAFLVFSLAAMLVSVLYYAALVDNRPYQGAREYYAGEASEVALVETAPQQQATDGLDDGPQIDFPHEMADEEMHESSPMLLSMSWRKLLEVTHFHLFTVPVFLLIIAHIFMMCPMAPSLRIGIIGSGVMSAAAHMVAPWMIYWGGGSWAWLMPVTGTWMTVSMLALTIWPCWAMWRKPAAERASRRS